MQLACTYALIILNVQYCSSTTGHGLERQRSLPTGSAELAA